MSRRLLIVLGLLLLAVGGLLWALRGPSLPAPVDQAPALPTPTPAPEQRVILLFPGDDGLLHPELRVVPLPVEARARAEVVLRELLDGSREGRHPVAPYAVELLAVFVDGRGRAFVDLSPPPQALEGLSTELLLAYGVVDSVLLNCPELTAVQILFGGGEVATLTGHLDLSAPLALNKSLIASS